MFAMQFVPIAVNTLVIYLFLIVAVRIFGRRQLGQLTPIDVLVIILLGSCVETAMIHGDSSLKAGLLSATVLLITNRALAFLFSKSKRLRHIFVSGPTLIVHNGKLVQTNMDKLGLTERDVMEGIRAREQTDLKNIKFGVMEPDGTINVVCYDKC